MINSILLAFTNAGSIVGSLIGSLVVGSSATTTAATTTDNGSTASSLYVTSDSYDDVSTSNVTSLGVSCPSPGDPPVCGVGHCPFVAEHVTGFAPSDRRLIYVVAGVSLAFNVGALIVSTAVLKPPPGSPRSPSLVGGWCGGVGHRRRRSAGDERNGHRTSSTGSVVVVVGSGRVTEVHSLSKECVRSLGAAAAAAAVASDERREDGDGLVTNRAKNPAETSVRKRIAGTFRLLADHRLQLLIPSVIMMGVVSSFSVGAFNQVCIWLYGE